MKNIILLVLFVVNSALGISQPNCNVYKFEKNEPCYRGCLEAMKAIEYRQGSKESQIHFDKAIELCPSLAYAYREKAVPYLKRGDFVTWKKLIDLAVKYEPEQYLGIRAWCRFKFLRDYSAAINDIEKLEEIINYDIGYSGDGDYHMNIVKALCYKGLGHKEKAIEIIEKQLVADDYEAGLYDYLHLGVLRMETDDYAGAIKTFQQQITSNDYLAETYFFMAKSYQKLSDETNYLKNLELAKAYYLKGKYRRDSYVTSLDKIFLEAIEEEINNAFSNK